MDVKELEPLGPKTTMRIGGKARYFALLTTREDVEAAQTFAREKNLPLIVLGGGSNTIFADDVIDAFVVRIAHSAVTVEGENVSVGSGKNLPMLINELAKQNLDLSPLTGILGSVGGAVFGNAGQGPQGIWIDSFITSITVFLNGEWKEFTKEECAFAYRESTFKHRSDPLIIWEASLHVPSRPQSETEEEIKKLLQKRIETQPHVKTAGSCFKAKDGVPAWQLIEKAGLRGSSVGGVQIAEKHANFLLNTGGATFDDAVRVVENAREKVGDLDVEMRFVTEDGSVKF